MIDEKIREAWKTWKGSANVEQLLRAACVLVDAYIQAEAGARMWEFWNEHQLHDRVKCEWNADYYAQHNWTLADWVAEVRTELEGP